MTNQNLLEAIEGLKKFNNVNISVLDNGYTGLYFDSKVGNVGYAYELNDRALTTYSLDFSNYQEVYDVNYYDSHEDFLDSMTELGNEDVEAIVENHAPEKEVRAKVARLKGTKISDLPQGVIIWKGDELLGVTGHGMESLNDYLECSARPINGNSNDYELII